MLKARNAQKRSQKKAPSRKAGGTQAAVSRFSGQSFVGGLVCGAATVLAFMYGPGLWSGTTDDDSLVGVAERQSVTYEFMNRLPTAEVVTNVTPFEPPPPEAANEEQATPSAEPAPAAATLAAGDAEPAETGRKAVSVESAASEESGASERAASTYLLQAASFRDKDDANAMRATLLLEGMNAAVNEAPNADGAWYRVVVGPFTSEGDLERTLTQLRTRDIPAVRVPPG